MNPERKRDQSGGSLQVTVPARRANDDPPALERCGAGQIGDPFKSFDRRLSTRARAEADEFYDRIITPETLNEDQLARDAAGAGGNVVDQAVFLFQCGPVAGRTRHRPAHQTGHNGSRNSEWFHMVQQRRYLDARQVGVSVVCGMGPGVSHRLRCRLVDIDFAKEQFDLMLQEFISASERDRFRRTNGISATSIRLCMPGRRCFSIAWRARCAGRRHRISEAIFSKLMLNFSWWVNRKDPYGRNVFEGGFLGLDNIGVFDRSRAAAYRRLSGAG